MEKNMVLFALSANRRLAAKIAELLGISLGKNDLFRFADGEIMARTLENVRGKKVYVIQSTNAPSEERIFEILVFVNSLRNANAAEVNIILPYYGYSRQDRVALPGEPITARMLASLYQAVGIDRLIAIDLHTPQIQGFFSCPVVDLMTTDLFGAYFNEKFKKLGIKGSDVCVVSPDHGSASRARDLGSLIPGASIAVVDKRRPAPDKSEIISIVGDVKDKVCLIVDDIIDTCGTVNNAAEILRKHGAKRIFACASHAVFVTNNVDPAVEEVVVTDTIEKDVKGVTVLSVAPLLADFLRKD